MSKDVVMPALGMAQETGTLLRWLKAPGEQVAKGEMLMEIETDKANVEIEAPSSGMLCDVTAQPGDVIVVGKVIARIVDSEGNGGEIPAAGNKGNLRVSPVAARIAQENNIDLSHIRTARGVVQKEDVLALLKAKGERGQELTAKNNVAQSSVLVPKFSRPLASPKARRLARGRGIDLKTLRGSGPDGAVLAADVLKVGASAVPSIPRDQLSSGTATDVERLAVSNIWRVMVERLSNAWATVPHFYLTRDVNATRLMQWRESKKATLEEITYTDLLVKLAAAAIQKQPRVNASWQDNALQMNRAINIGLAVAVEQGLVVPVIHNADELSLKQIMARRMELLERAHAGKLSLSDISGGTFTISNLGMYGVDAFNAIVNPPQAAILAVSRIAERVVPVNHQPSVQPMMTLTLGCDHRVVDGARAAQFLDALAQLIEEPLTLLD